MTGYLSRRETHPRATARKAAARLRRLAVALAVAACGSECGLSLRQMWRRLPWYGYAAAGAACPS